MPNTSDREYFEQRRRECAQRAERANDPGIARIYRDFADRYELAAQNLSSDRSRDMHKLYITSNQRTE